MQFRYSPILLIASFAAIFLTACPEQQAPVNRIDPNLVKKSLFVGNDLHDPSDDPEFYTQQTLTDVPSGSGLPGRMFSGNHSDKLARVKFIINETTLEARLTYAYFSGTDGKGVGPTSVDGVTVGTWAIKRQSDVGYQYNPTTGEKNNVLVELQDRPWYDREYMLIDWSKNLTPGFDFDVYSGMGLGSQVRFEPIATEQTDPYSPDAPHFTIKNQGTKDEQMVAFDITQQAFAYPNTLDFPQWGVKGFPACMLPNAIRGGTQGSGQCNPVRVSVRVGFKRVDPNESDYEPIDYDGIRFRAFGAFDMVERNGFSRDYGFQDTEHFRFMQRYNLWNRSHYYYDSQNMTGSVPCYTPETTIPASADPNRDLLPSRQVGGKTVVGDGTADECAEVTLATGHPGSQCDKFSNKCTLPYRDRTEKPIVWYVTEGSNFDFWDGTVAAVKEWDVALRHAVMTARYAECMRQVENADLYPMTAARCAQDFPVLTGQNEDQIAAIRLATEVDDCRAGRGTWSDADRGTEKDPWGRPTCTPVADSLGTARKVTDQVKALAKKSEMLVLCHSPVQADDHPLCSQPGEFRLPVGMTAAACSTVKADNKAMLAKCHCADGVSDYAHCTQPIKSARMGDLSYHQVNLIRQPQDGSPWGVMQDAQDPMTGQTVSASINVWTDVNYKVTRSLVDRVRLINGEITPASITDATYVKDFIAVSTLAGSHSAPTLSDETINSRLSTLGGRSSFGVINPPAPNSGASTLTAAQRQDFQGMFKSAVSQVADIRATYNYAGATSIVANARRKVLQDSLIEADLMKPAAMLQIAGNFTGVMGTTGNIVAYQQALVSPIRLSDPGVVLDLEENKNAAVNSTGGCMMDQNEAPVPLATGALAAPLLAKFPLAAPASASKPNDDLVSRQVDRSNAMQAYLNQKVQYNCIIHEMGHSFGLRHNFVSSSDAYNYRPQYWQLRTNNNNNNMGSMPVCTGAVAQSTNPTCIGPRYYSPLSKVETDNMEAMFQQSSVMDYAGDVTQDFLGLGSYDFAAVRMFYGDVAAVYSNQAMSTGANRIYIVGNKADNFGGILGIMYTDLKDGPFSYAELQNRIGLINSCVSVGNAAQLRSNFQPKNWNATRDGQWSPLLDGLFVSVVDGDPEAKMYSACKTAPVDYVQWSGLDTGYSILSGLYNAAGIDQFSQRHGPIADRQKRLRVPYGFATDTWADLGNLSVYRHDNGADPYELFDYLISTQEVNHIFTNYRRSNAQFNVYGAAAGTLTRFNTKMRDAAKGLGLILNNLQESSKAYNINYDALFVDQMGGAGLAPNLLASAMAFDHFARQLARPEAGDHFLPTGGNVLRTMDLWNPSTTPSVDLTVPNGAYGTPFKEIGFGGRLIENQLDDGKKQGEYSTEYTLNSGSYYEKAFTGLLLTESRDNFVSASRPDFVDGRYRAIGMADVFPEGFRRWLGNNLTGDDYIKGPRVTATSATTPELDASSGIKYPLHGISWTDWTNPSGPQICLDSTSNLGTLSGNPEANFKCTTVDPTKSIAIDPQIGFEQQRLIFLYTLINLPSNQKNMWIDMMYLWHFGRDSEPNFPNRIEYHSPWSAAYVARAYGSEQIFGQTVQKGIAARTLEWANTLVKDCVETTSATDGYGNTWYVPVIGSTGQPIYKFIGQTTYSRDNQGRAISVTWAGRSGCDSSDDSGCMESENPQCAKLRDYEGLLSYMRDLMDKFDMDPPSFKGVY